MKLGSLVPEVATSAIGRLASNVSGLPVGKAEVVAAMAGLEGLRSKFTLPDGFSVTDVAAGASARAKEGVGRVYEDAFAAAGNTQEAIAIAAEQSRGEIEKAVTEALSSAGDAATTLTSEALNAIVESVVQSIAVDMIASAAGDMVAEAAGDLAGFAVSTAIEVALG